MDSVRLYSYRGGIILLSAKVALSPKPIWPSMLGTWGLIPLDVERLIVEALSIPPSDADLGALPNVLSIVSCVCRRFKELVNTQSHTRVARVILTDLLHIPSGLTLMSTTLLSYNTKEVYDCSEERPFNHRHSVV